MDFRADILYSLEEPRLWNFSGKTTNAVFYDLQIVVNLVKKFFANLQYTEPLKLKILFGPNFGYYHNYRKVTVRTLILCEPRSEDNTKDTVGKDLLWCQIISVVSLYQIMTLLFKIHIVLKRMHSKNII